MRDYLTLHLQTQIKVKKQLVVRKDMNVKNMRDYLTLHLQTQIKVKEQLVVRRDMNVNKHERLSNITFSHKLK